ncbi:MULTISPECIES: hypothetical protein [Bartonella]|uniref:hypothetical protein n=1 Tax=Bartonella TaxID=773 RepID=UPI0018DBF9F9|nr:hypothetical protein [Bartonella choladocola]MBI0140372.1 hypothetical protein [Bartonella choladocola]
MRAADNLFRTLVKCCPPEMISSPEIGRILDRENGMRNFAENWHFRSKSSERVMKLV